MKKNFNENVVEFLKVEETMIKGKIKKCLSDNNFSMYKNLIQAYEKVVELIKKYDWQLKYSECETVDSNNNPITRISIWEQNGDQQIRTRKVWGIRNIDNVINNDSITNECYVISTDITNGILKVLFNGQCFKLQFDESALLRKQIVDKILKIINRNKNVKIYVAPNVEGSYCITLYLQQQGFKSYDLCNKLM